MSYGERGIIDYHQTGMEPCECGGEMNNISLHYGRTPYGLFCPSCKTTYGNKITNCDVPGALKAWNEFRRGGENPFEIKAYAKPIQKKEAAVPKDFTIRELQTTLPWTIRYSNDFRSSPVSHKDFAHALHHVSKAAGKLHGLADDMDHDRALADCGALRLNYGKYVADLVVCALRLANTMPGGVLDLQTAVQERIENKNGVELPKES